METKKIDWYKLERIVKERGITKGRLAVEIGRDKSYLSVCKNRGRQPSKAEKLAICAVIGCKPEDIEVVDEEDEKTPSDGSIEALSRSIDREINMIRKQIEHIRQDVDGVRNLLAGVNGIAAMSGRIKELQELMDVALKADGADAKAERLIISMIQDGMVEENELMNRAQAENIGRPDIHRARHRLGMQIITKGYGANQKKYLALRRV